MVKLKYTLLSPFIFLLSVLIWLAIVLLVILCLPLVVINVFDEFWDSLVNKDLGDSYGC